nr:(2Fe-2S) ferredoxin domain-containing protein [Corynebacterium lactis]
MTDEVVETVASHRSEQLAEQLPNHIVVVMSWADANSAEAWREQARVLGAECAFVQGATPALAEVLDECKDRQEIVLVPVTLDAALGKSWVSRIARWWMGEANWQGKMQMAPVVRGELERLPSREELTELRAGGAGLTNPAWENQPPVSKHVIVCQGPRCHAKGAAETMRRINAVLAREGMADTSVLVTQAGCLYPCNRAPVVCVQPDMDWIGPVHADDAEGLVADLQRGIRREAN